MKRPLAITALAFAILFTFSSFSHASEEGKTNYWSGNVTLSYWSDYLVEGVPFLIHNQEVGLLSAWLGDSKGTHSIWAYGAVSSRYRETGINYMLKFDENFRAIIFPFTWNIDGRSDWGVVFGIEAFSEELPLNPRIGFLVGRVAKETEFNGYTGYVALQETVFTVGLEGKVGFNSHFFCPEAHDLYATIKACRKFKLTKELFSEGFIQKYWANKSINCHNEFVWGVNFIMDLGRL
jgi:hypothetical protein